MAAVLAGGPGAVLSHRGAGAHWELRPTASPVLDVTVPSRSGRRHRGILLHRSATLSASDVVHHRGIPVTSPARTIVDLADVLTTQALARVVEGAETLRLLDLRALRAAMAANPTRRGHASIAEVLARYLDVSTTRSELERLFLELCNKHGLPRPLVNSRVGPYEVDFLWPQQRLIVETDGRSHHATRAAFERDRARDAGLTLAGYRVVRFTYRQVTREPKKVAGLVRSLLEGDAQPSERSISSTR